MEPINLLMAADENFFLPFLTAIFSISQNTSRHINLFFVGSLSTFQLEQLSIKCPNVVVTLIDDRQTCFAMLDKAKTTSDFPKCSLYRILCPLFLPNVGRVLWIDSDVVVNKDIGTIFDTNLSGKAVGAMVDHSDRVSAVKSVAGRQINKYFMSGLLLFDLDAIRKKYSTHQIQECIDVVGHNTSYPDQDILNVLFSHDVLYFDECYQVLIWNQFMAPKINTDEYVVYHFPGDSKPFQKSFYNFKNEKIFWKYAKETYGKKQYGIIMRKQRQNMILKSIKRLLHIS